MTYSHPLRLAFIALFALLSASAFAVQIGDPAPAFEAPATGGKTIRLADYQGKWLILYFYPKSGTPGCTREACSLRDGMEGLEAVQAVVLGVSVDPLSAQEEFKKEHNLPFDLLSDEKKEISKAYNALGALELMSLRKTFIISPVGKIAHIIEAVDTAKHAEQVTEALTILQTQAK